MKLEAYEVLTHESEGASHHDSLLVADSDAGQDVNVKDGGQLALGREGLSRSDRTNDLLGDGSALGDVLELGRLVLDHEAGHDGPRDCDTREDG